jgi:aminopeptidase N
MVTGNVYISFTPLVQSDTLTLDAIYLNIDQVSLEKGAQQKELRFEDNNNKVLIYLDKNYKPGDTLTTIIKYMAQPNAGMYFIKDIKPSELRYCFTYGEGGLHANWLPIYNDVNDKFSSEMIVTVNESYWVVSNGKLHSIAQAASGQKQYHWQQKLPHSNYLIALYIGQFDQGELPSAFGTIPIRYWVPQGKIKEADYVFRNTSKMIEFFSEIFNYAYPWEKYDQIVIPNYAIGGMEHTSVTGLRDYILRDNTAPHPTSPQFDHYWTDWTAEGLISHELAHMWFGNNVTCRHLNFIWLNESFATYMQLLWEAESKGREVFDLERQIMLDNYLNYVRTKHIIRPLEYQHYDRVGDIYNEAHSYLKGALTLHMMQKILGADDFYRACSHYLHKHEFSSVVSSDLKTAIEEATGRNLDWFFQDWIYGAGHPILEVSYKYLREYDVVNLQVNQIQPFVTGQDLFKIPMNVSITTANGTEQHTVWIEEAVENFVISCSAQPLLVSMDGEGVIVAEIIFEKSIDELIYQVKNDQLAGRFWALRQLTERYPGHPATIQIITHVISEPYFWGLKAEAAFLLGKIRSKEAERVMSDALEHSDHRVRKAALIALRDFSPLFAEDQVKTSIENDANNDIVATAIVSLARIKPQGNIEFIRKQLHRISWYDEIKIACLKAFAVIGDKSVLPDIIPLTEFSFPHEIHAAALQAWQACSPDDPKLQEILIQRFESAPYQTQYLIIDMLGEMCLEKGLPLLEHISATSGDADMRYDAHQTGLKIRRIIDKL